MQTACVQGFWKKYCNFSFNRIFSKIPTLIIQLKEIKIIQLKLFFPETLYATKPCSLAAAACRKSPKVFSI